MFEHILSVIIFLPILAGLLVLITPASRAVARCTGIIISLAILVLSVDLYSGFKATGCLEFVEIIPWIPSLGVSYSLGVDGISLFILMAGSVLLPMIYFVFATKEKGYYANLLIVQGAMAGALCAADMILFYIFWEIMLLPVFFYAWAIWRPEENISYLENNYLYHSRFFTDAGSYRVSWSKLSYTI